jgi:hypothetical protein
LNNLGTILRGGPARSPAQVFARAQKSADSGHCPPSAGGAPALAMVH